MKNFVRLFAIALTLTGTAASLAAIEKPAPKPSDFPLPVCNPDDPSHCGMGQTQ